LIGFDWQFLHVLYIRFHNKNFCIFWAWKKILKR
jgi:hypothetical protein